MENIINTDTNIDNSYNCDNECWNNIIAMTMIIIYLVLTIAMIKD